MVQERYGSCSQEAPSEIVMKAKELRFEEAYKKWELTRTKASSIAREYGFDPDGFEDRLYRRWRQEEYRELGLPEDELEKAYWTSYCEHGRESPRTLAKRFGCSERAMEKWLWKRWRQEFEKQSRSRVKKSARKRQKRIRAGEQISEEQIEQLLKSQNYTCAYCEQRLSLNSPPMDPECPTIDHVLPLSAGGSHTIGNVVLACRSCNSKKGNNPLTKLDINTAPAEAFCLFYGIGPKIAQRIVKFRELNGPFNDPKGLLQIPGVTDLIHQRLKGFTFASEPGDSSIEVHVDINNATAEEMHRVAGVPMRIAKRVAWCREKYGKFESPEVLLQIPGIGEVTYRKLKNFSTTRRIPAEP